MPVALVVRCRCRSSIPGSPLQIFWNSNNLHRLFKNKAPCLAFNITQPVRWKWKKKTVGLSSIVKTKFASTSLCAIPKCQSCKLAWARQRSPKIKQVQLNFDSEGAISCAIPKCQSCEFARARQRSPKIKQVQSNLDSEGAISCAIPKCQSCELAWAQQRSPKVKKVQSNLDSDGAISCAILKCHSCELA